MTIAFGACLVVSAAVLVFMASKNYSNIDANYWMIVIIIPLVIMGYWLKTQVDTPEAAAMLFCFIYLDSTFLLLAALFSMMHAMGFQSKPWMKVVAYSAACVHIGVVCLNVHTDLYYQSMTIIPTVLGNATKMTSGPLKLVHYVFLTLLVVWFVGVLIASVFRKTTYSRRSFIAYSILIAAGIAINMLEGYFDIDFTTLPFLYVIGDLVIALNYDYVHTHDIVYVLSSQQKHYGSRGYVAISPNR